MVPHFPHFGSASMLAVLAVLATICNSGSGAVINSSSIKLRSSPQNHQRFSFVCVFSLRLLTNCSLVSWLILLPMELVLTIRCPLGFCLEFLAFWVVKLDLK
jgi:hypothetical protein